jgi:hypothetical protein
MASDPQTPSTAQTSSPQASLGVQQKYQPPE